MATPEEPTAAEGEQDEVQSFSVEYRKTEQYRAFHVDGVHGAITPNGRVNAYFYAENPRLPEETVQRFDSGDETELEHRYSSAAISLREVEGVLTMSPQTALSLLEWLLDKVVAAADYGLVSEDQLDELGKRFEEVRSDGE